MFMFAVNIILLNPAMKYFGQSVTKKIFWLCHFFIFFFFCALTSYENYILLFFVLCLMSLKLNTVIKVFTVLLWISLN